MRIQSGSSDVVDNFRICTSNQQLIIKFEVISRAAVHFGLRQVRPNRRKINPISFPQIVGAPFSLLMKTTATAKYVRRINLQPTA